MVALFVLAMFILFIVVDFFVLKAQKKSHPAFEGRTSIADQIVFSLKNLFIPQGVYLSNGHTWAEKNEYGLIKVGVDDLILKALGKITFLNAVPAGQEVKKGDFLFEAKAAGRTLKFRSPINGVVDFVNPDLIGKNIKEPYGDNWTVLLTPKQFQEDRKSMINGAEAETWMHKEFKRLKDFISVHVLKPELAGATMYDGGNIVEGAVGYINDEGFSEFEKEFLTL